MKAPCLKSLILSESDLDFVVQQGAPDFKDKAKLKQLIREDEDFRKGVVGSEHLFRTVMRSDDIFLRISPALFFEVLLRRVEKELEQIGHTFERTGNQRVVVFDANAVMDFLRTQSMPYYLADLLSSFTRVEGYVLWVKARKGTWRKVTFSDLDLDSLRRICEAIDEQYRFNLYKRIADVCLFIVGIFPDYALFDSLQIGSGKLKPGFLGWLGRNQDEYEEEGKRFYRLAAEHPAADKLGLSEIFHLLHKHFVTAKKPLNFISEHYLRLKKQGSFECES